MEKEIIGRVGYLIDEEGFVIETIVVYSENEGVEGNIVTVSQPLGISFYRRKWNGTEWIEGESKLDKEAREYDIYNNKITPNKDKIQDALITIKCVEVLKEMGIG